MTLHISQMPKKKNDRLSMWIEIAKSDLKSAQLLYKNGHHRNSYYFFQQASEKALKALSLNYEFTSEKEFQNIRHDVFKLFKIFVDKQEQKIISSIKDLPLNPDDLKKIDEFKENQTQFEELKKTFTSSTNEKIINISEEELDSLLQELKDSLFYNLNIPKMYGKRAKEKISTFLIWLEKAKEKRSLHFKEAIEMSMKDEKTFKDLYETFAKSIDIFIGALSAGYAISICAFITAKHNNLTRYPHEELNPIIAYSADLPIIRKQPEFMKVLNRALKNLS